MTETMRAQSAAEWDVGTLGLDAYLARIGHRGPIDPTAAVLRELHHAHATTIPFENLDVVLGRTLGLDLDDLQDKLVRRRRGGYCYEHSLLFGAVLERAGFTVTRLAARVGTLEQLRPRSHMLLLADDRDGSPWLADVGFGAALLEPVPFEDGAVSRQGDWTFRLERAPAGVWRLRSLLGRPAEWSDLYTFTLEPQHLVDYVVSNHFTATHPSSPFVGHPVAMRTEPRFRLILRDHELLSARPDGDDDPRALTDDEVLHELTTTFGIDLTPAETAQLRARIAPRAAGG
jgi:N-hydroxyarylamine O-acetyltransferase